MPGHFSLGFSLEKIALGRQKHRVNINLIKGRVYEVFAKTKRRISRSEWRESSCNNINILFVNCSIVWANKKLREDRFDYHRIIDFYITPNCFSTISIMTEVLLIAYFLSFWRDTCECFLLLEITMQLYYSAQNIRQLEMPAKYQEKNSISLSCW